MNARLQTATILEFFLWVGGAWAAARWAEGTVARLTLALLALVVLAWRRLPETLRTRLLVGLALAAVTVAAAEDLGRFATGSWVRVWNVYHYYLGSKYFAELGYYDLYDATLAADAAGNDYWHEVDRVRDLRTYDVEERAARAARYPPAEHFTPERWAAFRRDVEALAPQMPPRDWRGVFRDRGYNGTPFWTALGAGLAHLLPATRPATLKLLAGLDLLLLGWALWLLYRAFGARRVALVALLLFLSPVNIGRFVGGFLQYDWFVAVAAALCFYRRRRPATAGMLMAYAVLARVFPLIFVVSWALPVARRWWRARRPGRGELRFLVAFVLACGAGLGVGCLAGRGPASWTEFAEAISLHKEEHRYGERRVGLQHVFTHDLADLELDESLAQRRRLYERQEGAYVVVAAVLLVLYLAVARRRPPPDALLLGLVPLFVLTVASRYYWSYLALLPLLSGRHAGGRRRRRRLGAAQLLVFAGYYFYFWLRPDRYAAYSVFNLLLAAFFLLLLVSYLWPPRRWRRRAPERSRRSGKAAFFLALFVLLCVLRMPVPGVPIRDVDEAVSAIIATTWLEGGVPYRDAIDQRGPVTYLLYAFIFRLAGSWNMAAVHWGLLLLVLSGAFLVHRLGRRLEGDALGLTAALIFAFASYTYRRSQMLAFHTEWPMMILTTLGMLLLAALGRERRAPMLFAAGLCFGGAFLGKQPAIFDAAAAGGSFLLWRWRAGRLLKPGGAATAAGAAALAGGFLAAVGACALYFFLHGALGDFYLYFWSYNVEHYTAVVPVAERLAALNPFLHHRHYLTHNPLLLVGVALGMGWAGVAFVRQRRVDGRLLLALWFAAAWFGASYSGRNFGHYFIQILPSACLLTAWVAVALWRRCGTLEAALARRCLRGVLVLAVALGLAVPLARYRHDIAWRNLARPRGGPPRVLEEVVEEVRRRAGPEDPIFVWGYNPEIYVLARRRPASRYSNTNYLTGMLPWENHRPGVDTSAHIVPGAWDILMRELAAHPPRLILDTAPGDHRYYAKYPISDFPPLARFVARGYRPAGVVPAPGGGPYYVLYERRAP